MNDPVVVVSAARTPMGAFQGELSTLSAAELGGAAIRAVLERAGARVPSVGEVLMGNCLMAGQGQAPARQAVFHAGLPASTGAVTLSKMCGSGMKAAMLAHDMLVAGSHEVMVAGGMESMTNAPYLLPMARGGYRMGHGRVVDHMMFDGLEDATSPVGRWALSGGIARRNTALRARSRTRLHGGACALGHPIGASGARVIVTLLNALRRRGGRRGIATLCLGGGEATAMAFELV